MRERRDLSLGPSEPAAKTNGSLYPEDDFVPGTVIACITDRKPEVGVIVRVEQQAWNAVVRGREKTVVVRFAEGTERQINPYTRTSHTQQRNPSLIVLLRPGEAVAVMHRMQDRLHRETGDRSAPPQDPETSILNLGAPTGSVRPTAAI
jgi:hypothetical protein